jgi:hypothetical protein
MLVDKGSAASFIRKSKVGTIQKINPLPAT